MNAISGSATATITIGTLVAFTQLQTRVFFPIQSLLSVQICSCPRWSFRT